MWQSAFSRAAAVAVLSAFALAGCIHIYHDVDRTEFAGGAAIGRVASPVRAHLADGSVIVYANGLMVSRDSLSGSGLRYDALRDAPVAVSGSIPLTQVIGLEAYSSRTNTDRSFVTSALATVGITVVSVAGLVAIACAIDPKCFGSCPTIYTAAEDGEVLEAELFSYSVAPLLEARDVDRLGVRADADGFVVLDVRNEALETHHINHLELLEVQHAADEVVMPSERGRPVIVGELRAATARDAHGRDVTAVLAARDSQYFASDEGALARASLDALHDHIDLALPVARGRDSVAVVLRLRNSLLNTVLFYDMMLGAAGARALDWLGSDLQRVGPAVQLGQWYRSRFGMWVSVESHGEYREVARIPDAGPIAWKDVAVLVPVPEHADSIRIRLSFVLDEWRIDRVAIAHNARSAAPRLLPLADAHDRSGTSVPDALQRLSHADEAYVETRPGDSFIARFDAGPEPAAGTRTFLLSSQGYYIEWIRPVWISGSSPMQTFQPRDETLLEALRRWHAVKPEFEMRFHDTRIPVR